MTESARRARLAENGHNPLRLPAAHVRFDCFSDVPHRVLIPDGARDTRDADLDQVYAAFAPLTGDAKLAIATKGRAAEAALVDALELPERPVVLTHGVFTTTATALGRRAAVIEEVPAAGADGTSDVDLDALETRLARGGVHAVYLEVANSAWFGWPLAEANVAAVRAACDRHGAKLFLDATRPLANAHALGERDVVAATHRMLALAHAFTIACAKELLVPVGAVVGSTDSALIARVWMQLFKAGTSLSAIDPAQARADLRDGARHVLAHPELVSNRRELARRIARALAGNGVTPVEPVTAHAVFLPIDRGLLAGDVPALISLLAHLYAIAGVRAQVTSTKRGPCLRLALPLRTAFSDDDVHELATGVAAFFARIGERQALEPVADQVDVPYFRRFSPVSGRTSS